MVATVRRCLAVLCLTSGAAAYAPASSVLASSTSSPICVTPLSRRTNDPLAQYDSDMGPLVQLRGRLSQYGSAARRAFANYNYQVDMKTAQIMGSLPMQKPVAPAKEPQELSLDQKELWAMPIGDVKAKFEGRVVPSYRRLTGKEWAAKVMESRANPRPGQSRVATKERAKGSWSQSVQAGL